VTYIVTGRHPLDMFVSLRHQLDNLHGSQPRHPDEPLRAGLLRWIGEAGTAGPYPESLPKVMWHLSDAWARRAEPNVLLVHYDDLSADLAGQMRGIARRLGITVPEASWPALIEAATFRRMRDSADRLVPAAPGMFSDTASFFRRGTSGAGREILSAAEMAGYHARVARLAPPDMLGWLHSPPVR
jgi:hypothetical protein